MIGTILHTVSIWFAAPIWQLWRLARVKPIYGTMNSNLRAETTILAMYLGVGAMRFLVVGNAEITEARVFVLFMAMVVWMSIARGFVHLVLRSTGTIFPSFKQRKAFVDLATLAALGSSAIIGLVATLLDVLMPNMNEATASFAYGALLLSEIYLVVGNVMALRGQAMQAAFLNRCLCARS